MRNFAPLAALVFAVAMAACQPQGQAGPETNASANKRSPIDRLAVAEPPMDRAALLLAAAKAASASALGQVDVDQRRLLDGKRFELRIRFGCPNDPQPPQAGAATFEVRFDEVDRMLRIRARPDLRIDDPRIASIGGPTVEAVEGFWLRRPWLLAAGCLSAIAPPPPDANADADADAEGAKIAVAGDKKAPVSTLAPDRGYRVGIAEFLTEAHSRTTRRDGRAYETTKVLGGVQGPSESGYNLVLSGRLRQLPSGRVISCVAADPDQPPECVISAQFDRVRIESPNTREILAEWSS